MSIPFDYSRLTDILRTTACPHSSPLSREIWVREWVKVDLTEDGVLCTCFADPLAQPDTPGKDEHFASGVASSAAGQAALGELAQLDLNGALDLLREWNAAGRPHRFDEWAVAHVRATRGTPDAAAAR